MIIELPLCIINKTKLRKKIVCSPYQKYFEHPFAILLFRATIRSLIFSKEIHVIRLKWHINITFGKVFGLTTTVLTLCK